MKLRKITIKNGICKIPLTQGKFAYCDESDYDLVKDSNWSVLKAPNNRFYASSKGKYMHRILLKLNRRSKLEVDHKDHDGLNNRRNNIRKCSRQQNIFNQRLRKNNKSKFKGICWYQDKNKWKAQIQLSRKTIFLGYFKKKSEAIKAYMKIAKKYHKNFIFNN